MSSPTTKTYFISGTFSKGIPGENPRFDLALTLTLDWSNPEKALNELKLNVGETLTNKGLSHLYVEIEHISIMETWMS